MAELATIARPYAEAMFKASQGADQAALAQQVRALADVAGDAQLRQFADNPSVSPAQVCEVMVSVVATPPADAVKNLLRAVVENGRLDALPQIAAQFQMLVNERTGVADAIIQSAFAIDEAQLADVVATLEKRFGRKLSAVVQIDPSLIGGIRAIVGDEVLDTSVKARLEQMKVALAA